jgi:hypothetical protein
MKLLRKIGFIARASSNRSGLGVWKKSTLVLAAPSTSANFMSGLDLHFPFSRVSMRSYSTVEGDGPSTSRESSQSSSEKVSALYMTGYPKMWYTDDIRGFLEAVLDRALDKRLELLQARDIDSKFESAQSVSPSDASSSPPDGPAWISEKAILQKLRATPLSELVGRISVPKSVRGVVLGHAVVTLSNPFALQLLLAELSPENIANDADFESTRHTFEGLVAKDYNVVLREREAKKAKRKEQLPPELQGSVFAEERLTHRVVGGGSASAAKASTLRHISIDRILLNPDLLWDVSLVHTPKFARAGAGTFPKALLPRPEKLNEGTEAEPGMTGFDEMGHETMGRDEDLDRCPTDRTYLDALQEGPNGPVAKRNRLNPYSLR